MGRLDDVGGDCARAAGMEAENADSSDEGDMSGIGSEERIASSDAGEE